MTFRALAGGVLVWTVAACAGSGGGGSTGTGSATAPVQGPAAAPPTTAAQATQAVPLGPGRVPGAVWPDEGPRTWAPRPTEPAITANDLRTRLYQIADDSMQGREAGTLGAWKGTDYVAAEFRRLGLQPAGDNGTYFQEIQFGPLLYDNNTVRLIVNRRTLTPGRDWVPSVPSAGAQVAGTFTADALPVVFGGRFGDTLTALDPNALRGRAVVFLAPAAPAAGGGGGRGGGAGGAAVRDLRAQAAGAALVLTVVDALATNTVNAAFNPRTGVPPVTTSRTAAANITAAAAAGLFDRPLAQLTPGTAGRSVQGSWTYEYRRPQYAARNVIAVMPGSDPNLRREYILVGAHNDHEGILTGNFPEHDSLRAFNQIMRPQGANDRPGAPTAAQQRQIDSLIAFARSVRPAQRDSIMNGADDDGSGTAILLEIAERFASGPAPKRSLIFISHAAEEAGLLGSEYFVEHPTVNRDSIVGALNMDMVGNGEVTDVRFGGPAQVQMLGSRRMSAEFGDMIDSINAVRSEPMAIDYSWDRTNALNRFCRSDQVSYFNNNIPVTYFSSGYSKDYHQATDEPRYINYDKSARIGRFVQEIMATLADRSRKLTVLPREQRDLSASCTP